MTKRIENAADLDALVTPDNVRLITIVAGDVIIANAPLIGVYVNGDFEIVLEGSEALVRFAFSKVTVYA